MTDTTTARINQKGLQSTGVTDDLARKLHDNLGMTQMAIVEYQAQSRTEDSDGKQSVQLVLLSVEPAPDGRAADHLRDLQRALYSNRRLHDEDHQPTLDSADDVEPTVDQVVDQGTHLTTHAGADT